MPKGVEGSEEMHRGGKGRHQLCSRLLQES